MMKTIGKKKKTHIIPNKPHSEEKKSLPSQEASWPLVKEGNHDFKNDELKNPSFEKKQIDAQEYNPDDEKEEDYGWDYNDSFDKLNEIEDLDITDEDKRYALGLDKEKD